MKLELILGTLDPAFNAALTAAASYPTVPYLVHEVRGTYNEVYDPVYLILASREFLDTISPDPQQLGIKVDGARHLIPYTIVTHREKIAVYSRTPKGNEVELHNQLSIGFGGHVDVAQCLFWCNGAESPNQVDVYNTLMASNLLELQQEFGLEEDNIVLADGFDLGVSLDLDAETVNNTAMDHTFIVSNANRTDERHLAILNTVEVKDITNLVIEDQLNFIGWYSEEEIKALLDTDFQKMESWSRIALEFGVNKIPNVFQSNS